MKLNLRINWWRIGGFVTVMIACLFLGFGGKISGPAGFTALMVSTVFLWNQEEKVDQKALESKR